MFGDRDAFFSQSKKIVIPQSAQVIVVADMFVEDYLGGAELTTQALIDSSPLEIFKLHSKDLNMDLLKEGVDRFWVFGNFSGMNGNLIPSIVGNLKYAILEYDYKYCRFRSPEKHFESTKIPCGCHNDSNGKMVSAFYYAAQGLFWMSEKQKERYHTLFPFLADRNNTVLSSVFDQKTLGSIQALRDANLQRKSWIVLGSNSWVKGASTAEKWCVDNEKDYEVVWNLPYDQLLAKLATSEGFVYLPSGADTCPRMVIEAKLLGCDLVLNDNVQHKDEEWFATDDLDSIKDYLYASPKVFWNSVKQMIDYKPTISGYMTVYNAVSQKYPYLQAIESMIQFCDEICVVDGGSTDGTWPAIQFLATADQRIKVKQVIRDWNHPRFAVFDGMQKAEARAMCTSTFCWQMDCDEIVHEDDSQKIVQLCSKMPKEVDIISLPVVEYWGNEGKVRMDVTPWKWRLSRNKPNITHGIPVELRLKDENGNFYAREGTDGCDMIDVGTGERIPHVSFYSPEVDNARQAALSGNLDAKRSYEAWFNDVIAQLPGVFHYSWYDLPRKIRLYKNYWTKHWNSLYGKSIDDTSENNMMFDVPWHQVTDEMIDARAKELLNIGGWVWHKKCPKNAYTPNITVLKDEPKIMKERLSK